MDLVLGISDAMTFVHVTELGYRNFVPEKRMVFT